MFQQTLDQLNSRFHDNFDAWLDDAVSSIAAGRVPVLMRLEDDVILRVGDSMHTFEINGCEYHQLKSLAHLPLLCFIESKSGRVKSSKLDEGIREVLGSVEQLERFGVSAGELNVALKEAIAAGSEPQSVLSDDQQVTRLQRRLIRQAADNEVARLVAAMKDIRDHKLSEQQYQQLHIVVCGGNQARYRNLSVKFFERWLHGDDGEQAPADHRVIYSESCDTMETAADLVAERIVNGRLADVFLSSPLSLDADVLGKAGLAAIDAALG